MLKCAVAASIGAATGCLLLLSILTWPAAWWTPGTARGLIILGAITTAATIVCRRSDQRHAEVMRTLRYHSIATEADDYLRGNRDG